MLVAFCVTHVVNNITVVSNRGDPGLILGELYPGIAICHCPNWQLPDTDTLHSMRLRIALQTVSSTFTRAYRLQLDSTIVQGAYGVLVRCNISSTASRY